MVLAVWTADAGRAFADLGLQGCPPGPSFSHFATPATTIGVPLRAIRRESRGDRRQGAVRESGESVSQGHGSRTTIAPRPPGMIFATRR
jgi:hypothetical protein